VNLFYFLAFFFLGLGSIFLSDLLHTFLNSLSPVAARLAFLIGSIAFSSFILPNAFTAEVL